MLFHASKIVSALILLNMSVSLAMKNGPLRQNSGGHNTAGTNQFGVRDQSISCGDRVYNQKDITKAIISRSNALFFIKQMGENISGMEYKPKSTEKMPLKGPFYSSELNGQALEQPRDLVIFTSHPKFAKVVTRHLDGRAGKYEDCVPSSETQPSERYSPKIQFSEGYSPERTLLLPKTQSPERSSLITPFWKLPFTRKFSKHNQESGSSS